MRILRARKTKERLHLAASGAHENSHVFPPPRDGVFQAARSAPLLGCHPLPALFKFASSDDLPLLDRTSSPIETLAQKV